MSTSSNGPVEGVCEIFNVGVTPASLAITPNGKTAYVANSNNYNIANADSVTVLDLKTGLPKLTIHDASFDEPYRIAIDECGKFAYVCNSGSPSQASQPGTVTIIDVHSNSVAGVITGFDGPGGIVLSKTLAYVTNYGAPGGVHSGNGNTVSVVDLQTRSIVATIVVDQAPAALALSPNHCFLYVISYVDGMPGTGVLSVIETKSNTVQARLVGFFGPFGIAISKSGRRAYVTNFGSNDFAPFGTTVSVVNLRRLYIRKNIEIGIQPSGVVVSPNGRYAYVSTYNALYAKGAPLFQNLTYGMGSVSVLCLRHGDQRIAPTIAVGQSPSTLAIAPDGNKLYACNYAQNTVTAICLKCCASKSKAPNCGKKHKKHRQRKHVSTSTSDTSTSSL